MLGATAVLSSLQVLFTSFGELGSLQPNYGAWEPLFMCCGVRHII